MGQVIELLTRITGVLIVGGLFLSIALTAGLALVSKIAPLFDKDKL